MREQAISSASSSPAISASTTTPIVPAEAGSASAARWMRERELGDGHGATVLRLRAPRGSSVSGDPGARRAA